MQTLYRPRDDRMIAGVCSGIARRFGIEPTIVRILFVASFLLPGPQILIYLAAWVLMPDESSIHGVPQRNGTTTAPIPRTPPPRQPLGPRPEGLSAVPDSGDRALENQARPVRGGVRVRGGQLLDPGQHAGHLSAGRARQVKRLGDSGVQVGPADPQP